MKTLITFLALSIATGASARQRILEQALPCGGPGYTATYSASTKAVPPMVDVTFRGTKPTSAAADIALRRCIKVAADTMFIRNELLGTVWFGRSKDDDSPVSLPDGSDHLIYEPNRKQIRTWNEHEGTKSSISRSNGYFVQYEEKKVLVKPGGTFATISVVFVKRPTEKVAYEAVIAEVMKAIDRTQRTMRTSAYAEVGSQGDPASWRQIKGGNGKYISAEFDPKSPKRITNASGEDLVAPVR